MDTNLPNLYTAFGLDRSDDCDALGIVLSARDLRLEQMGVTPDDPRRSQTVMAFAVLNNPAKRALYDEKIDAGIPLSWDQIQHLSNFGTIPATPEPPTPQPWQQTTSYTYGEPTTAFSGNTYNPFDNQVQSSMSGSAFTAGSPMVPFGGGNAMGPQRPTAGTRLGMAWLDLIIASIGAGLIVGMLGMNEFGSLVLSALLMIAYVVGFESIMGATPAKKFFGYEVRDVTTHSRLSAGAAAKRNWWKLVNGIPGGGLVTLIMAAIYGNQINEANMMRGGHDKLANAEVVKKQANS